MMERRCDCHACRSRRLAMWIFIAGVAMLMLAGIAARPAHAEDLTVCALLTLPGDKFTLNPNAPPDQRRQEQVHVCETISVPDPAHFLTPYAPISDFKTDRRVFT